MPTNPMQRKIRNSFILGVLVMLIVVIIAGAAIFFTVIKPKIDKEKEEQQKIAYVYRLKAGANVESGDEITSDMVECVEIPVTTNSTDFFTAKKLNADGSLTNTSFPGDYYSKISLKAGTILTKSMLKESEEETADSLRYVEYSMITMPTTLDVGDYIDVRFRISNGQDLIVISKKQIENIYENTIGLNLTEDEILLLNSAIVESYYIMDASELYAARYVEPGIQEAAKYTYTPTEEVINLIYLNENIVATAKENLIQRYNNSGVRNTINGTKSQYSVESQYNISEGISEQISAARKARENYLSELEEY